MGNWGTTAIGRAKHKLAAVIAVSLAGLGAMGSASAVSIDPGDYVAAPPGTDLFLFYGQHSEGKGLWAGGREVDPNARLNVDVAIARYVKFTTLGEHTLDWQVLVPWGHLSGGGSTASLGSTSGAGDIILVSTLWLLEDKQTRRYFGITPYIWAPTGNYDKNRALNMGENRWKGALQAVYSHGLGDHLTAELSFDAQVFGKNDDLAGGGTLKQDVLYDTQAFLRYTIDPKNEVSLKVRYLDGGETRINGVDQDNASRNWSVLGTYARALPGNTQLMLQVGRDMHIENGFKEESRVQVRFLKAF